MNSRFYNPNTGRFLTQDTYTGNAYEPWSQHLYSYCGNNPINFTDPTGHFATLIGGLIGAAAGAIYGGVKAAMNGEDVGAAIASGAVTGAIVGAAVGFAIDTCGAGTALSGTVIGAAFGVGVVAYGGYAGGVVGEYTKQTIELNHMGATTWSDYKDNYDVDRVNLVGSRTAVQAGTLYAALSNPGTYVGSAWRGSKAFPGTSVLKLHEVLYAKAYYRELIASFGVSEAWNIYLSNLWGPLDEPDYKVNGTTFDNVSPTSTGDTPTQATGSKPTQTTSNTGYSNKPPIKLPY